MREFVIRDRLAEGYPLQLPPDTLLEVRPGEREGNVEVPARAREVLRKLGFERFQVTPGLAVVKHVARCRFPVRELE